MKILRQVAAALPLALVACGGQGGPGARSAQASTYQAASPSYAGLAVDMDTAATAAGPAGVAAAAPQALSGMPGDAPCNPHLFLRAEGLAMRLNFHLWKFLRHVEWLVARPADGLSPHRALWHRMHGEVEVRWTVTQPDPMNDKIFDFKLEVRPAGSTDDGAWVQVFWGEIDRTDAAGPHQGKGNATLDLTALHGVDPLEPATGEIDVSFETFSDHRLVVFDAEDVVWDPAVDPVAMAMPLPFRSTPRNAHYVYFREKGKGGSFKAHDEMVFACPATAAGAAPAPTDVKALSRWFVADGAVHGRSDALATGGALPATDSLVGLTCHAATAETRPQVESYWFLKEEDATGATVQKWVPLGLDPSACDPAFGAVPSPDKKDTDFDFSSAGLVKDFDDATPAPFPGM
jgi:hypothetical protein